MLIIEWIFKLFPQSFLYFIELIIYGIRSGPRYGLRSGLRSGPRSGLRSGPRSGLRPGLRPGPRSGPIPVSDLLYTVSDFPLPVQDIPLSDFHQSSDFHL